MVNVFSMYFHNSVFRKYVDLYCNKHQIDFSTALEHKIVIAYAEQLNKQMNETI